MSLDKRIKWIPSRMATRFHDKLDYDQIENEQRAVILIYIKKDYFLPRKKARSLSVRGSFDLYLLLGSHSPPPNTFFHFVDGGWFVLELRALPSYNLYFLPLRYFMSLDKRIKWISSRMASRFHDKLDYDKIENEQRAVILIYIKKNILYLGRKREAFLSGVLLIFTFY